MADGRMLKNKISVDVRVADLANDTHRLLFTWGIAHLDVAGRITGEPREFKAKVVPMLDHITKDKILEFFTDAEQIGLIQRYEIKGKWTIQYPGFNKNQSLRENKEAPSTYPVPPLAPELPDKSGSSPGVIPELSGTTPLEEKGREEKGREGKAPAKSPSAPSTTPIYDCQSFVITPEHFADLLKTFPQFPEEYLLIEFFPQMRDWCLDHREDVKHRKKFDGSGHLKNVRGCFRNWLKTEDQAKAAGYRPRPRDHPPLPDPEGIVIPLRDCPACGGSGLTRTGPCTCLHPEDINATPERTAASN
jgi:hypothetical protein